jgi:hypothetical protein
MPTFRTAPTPGLHESISRAVAASRRGITPLDEAQVEQYRTKQDHELALTDKVRAEAEALRSAQADRTNPAVATEYAGNVAGMSGPDSTRLAAHLRGAMEPPSAADAQDAATVGAEAQPYPMAAPNLAQGQQRQFQSALAATLANRLATGKTNAEQLAHSGTRIDENALVNQAAGETNAPVANAIVAALARKPREPYATNAQGTVLNQETGALNEGGDLANAVRNLATAKAGTEASHAGAYDSQAGLSDVRAAQLPGEVASRIARNAAAAARTAAAPRGGTAVAPERIVRMIDMTSANEFKIEKAAWDALPAAKRKTVPAPTMASIRSGVEKRYRSSPAAADGTDDVAQAHSAIAGGADPEAVRARYRQRTGLELADPNEVEGE